MVVGCDNSTLACHRRRNRSYLPSKVFSKTLKLRYDSMNLIRVRHYLRFVVYICYYYTYVCTYYLRTVYILYYAMIYSGFQTTRANLSTVCNKIITPKYILM